MSGRTLPILPKNLLVFSTVGVGSTQVMILADRIELLHWRELTLILRVHSHTVSGTNQLAIYLTNMSWTEEDPGLDFQGAQIASFPIITSSTPSPSLFEISVPTLGTDCVANMARISALATRNAAATLAASVTLEFSTKDA